MSAIAPVPRGSIGNVRNDGTVEINGEFQRWLQLLQESYNTDVGKAVPTGTVVATMGVDNVGTTWLLLNGQTVLKRDYPALYRLLFGHVAETATTFTLPNMAGRTVMGAGSVALLAQAGAASVSLTIGNLPSHDHPVTDPQHSHGFTGSPHTHTITDPGHTHTAAALGAAMLPAGAGQNTAIAGNTGSAVTGITVDAATAGGTIANAATGVTVGAVGSGDPVDITPPILALNWLVKT